MSLVVVAALVAVASCSPQPPAEQSGEEARVREAFSQYKDALLHQDGEGAVTLVSAATLSYYEDMRRLAVNAGRPEIEAQSLSDRLFITMLRHEVGAAKLAGMSEEEEVFILAVDEGLVGAQGTIEAIDVGEITVSDDTATGEAMSQGQPTGISWEFRREDGAWKIHFVELLQLANVALEQAARESGLDETEFIFTLVESVSGRAVPRDIWEKPKRAA
jgi:hypothetical protein